MKKIIAVILALLLLGYLVFDVTCSGNKELIGQIEQFCSDMKNQGLALVADVPLSDAEGNPVLNVDGKPVTTPAGGWNKFVGNAKVFCSNLIRLLLKYSRFYTEGLSNTILLSIIALMLGTLLGALMALMRISNVGILRSFASVYIEIFRGTPLMVQLLFIYYGTGLTALFPSLSFISDFPRMMTCVVVMSLNSCAYVAEVIRSGIQAVDIGQMEAARSLGFSKGQSMRKVILPQAIRNILPALGNEFITVIKESSIVIYVGVADLMYRAKGVTSKTYIVLESYLIAAIIYFILTFCLSTLVDAVERRMKRGRV